MAADGATVGELLIMKRLDFIASILCFDVEHRLSSSDPAWHAFYPRYANRLYNMKSETQRLIKEARIIEEKLLDEH